MRLFLGADHRGFAEKQRLMGTLGHENLECEIVDLGPTTIKPDDDFNDPAIAVARAVRENPYGRGILICGSAHGIAIQANRFKGIRAICGYTPELVKLGRMHNDANILCLSLLLLLSIFPNIRVFSNELVLCIRWPNYWSFSFSFSPSKEYALLTSFRMGFLCG